MLTVIGCGNIKRHDGGVGVVVARRLARTLDQHPIPGVRVRDCDHDGLDVMLSARGSDDVIVVDAVQTDEEPGTIHEVTAAHLVLPPRPTRTPKELHWDQAVRACRQMVGLPKDGDHVVVYLIEAEHHGFGMGLSPRVEQAAEVVCERILARARQLAERRS